ncbi:ERCC4 domain-containing protein [Lysinibacillus sphaericus]|uniref:Phage DNA endonuclease n=1 Tax=Lysinibacillus sphaericus OT4b.31 TaxID=1285586 RepID=R7ZIF0_LYSSH|nr:ERCC4 domain-containing protein [Lysinibacillus sphaericus]EON73836.1 phage DNA endonuclease [Lysinibacillus sphaericus OT4b.31]
MITKFKYTDTELKKLLASMVVLVDTREQINQHITDYFNINNISYIAMKLDTGDYGAIIPQNFELGIYRDTYFPLTVERKNSIDELASSIKEERFEHELIRSQKSHFTLLVEGSYSDLVNGNYRSQYNPKALLARIKTFEARYRFSTTFLNDRQLSGDWIYHHLYYHVRAALKG